MKSSNEIQKFLDILEEIPNVSIAAKKACISKSTIYKWRKDIEDFAENMDQSLMRGRNAITDVVESQLIKQASRGEFRQMKFWLENNCDRYIRPRTINIINSKKNIDRPVEWIVTDFSNKQKFGDTIIESVDYSEDEANNNELTGS